MKLQFLGKKRSGCSKCGSSYSYESKTRYVLYSPFGLRTFYRGNIYEFIGDELKYWLIAGYGGGNKYFKKV